MTLERIKQKDTEWQAVSGVNKFIQSLMSNSAAQVLIRLQKTQPFFVETILMDRQGANVAVTYKTTAYWQGDETR